MLFYWMKGCRRQSVKVLCAIVISCGVWLSGLAWSRAVLAAEPGLLGKVIVLDAGHGGPDGGARGYHGLDEKMVTLPVTLKLAHLLRQAGAIVYLTRTTDDDLATDADRANGRRHKTDLRLRKEFSLSKSPDAFISVHCNAVPSANWYGSQTIYMKGNEQGKRLAEIMQAEFKQTLLPTQRPAEEMSTLYLLKRIPGPTVLAEVGFISNNQEGAALATSAYQQRIAMSIYISVMKYFGEISSPPMPQVTSS